jgi:hypothetical protein
VERVVSLLDRRGEARRIVSMRVRLPGTPRRTWVLGGLGAGLLLVVGVAAVWLARRRRRVVSGPLGGQRTMNGKVTVRLGLPKGGTRAPLTARAMHDPAGVPANGGEVTVAVVTRPEPAKTIRICAVPV